ncbi:MAG TPA: glycosyltransferase family 2 protein [Thermoanaerobaculia bacterium]|nr:glycosyltransferase family 2 protein [Thermoanaerobaculia bacterium]
MNEARVAAGGGPELSVVIPFYDEEAAVGALLDELYAVLAALDRSWEIVAVDDGSSDATPEILAAHARRRQELRVLRAPANRGQAAALWAGLRAARAEVIVTLDGDGQNDPADIPRLLDALGDAAMVVGIRRDRRDSALRRVLSRLANAVRGRLLGDRLHDGGCALKVLRREVIATLVPIRTLYSFLPALATAAGFEVRELEVRHRPRRGGASSYGLRVFLWRPLVDMLGVLWLRRRRFPPPDHAEVDPRPPASAPASPPADRPRSR